jgi:hypothetical protein
VFVDHDPPAEGGFTGEEAIAKRGADDDDEGAVRPIAGVEKPALQQWNLERAEVAA